MASGRSDEFHVSSDEEDDFFAGFTVEEIGQMMQDRQRRREQGSLRDVDEEIDALIDQEPQESASNSDVEVFADDGDEESSDEETASDTDSDDAPPNPLQWTNTLSGINVEEFSVRHGPSRDLGDNATAKDFFNLFINDEFLDEIVRHSIAYACSKGDANFVTNRAEISAYLGLNILIGIHELPQLAMYWDSDQFIGVEGFKKTIPKQRFTTLGKYFHLADPNTEDQADLLCKVRPLVTLLEQKFSEAYTPGKNISVDEGLVKFNGRLSFKQYMPMKPDKFGIKVWLLADADTYYVPRFQVYLGKNCTNSDLFRRKGLGYYVVWTLGEPYLDNNRHFFFDNFFTSADLMRDLQSRNTYACGTVRQNRKDFPADLKRMKLVAGEVRTRQSGNLVATMWRDKRVVSLLSTNTPPEPEIHAVQQVVRGRRKRVVPAESMKKPDVVVVYNSGMNGVDVNDQYRSYYPPGTTSRKWWKYLFWFFLNLAMVNGFILEKLAGKRKRRQLGFRRELAKLLIAGYNGYKRPSNSGKRAVSTFTTEENVRGHFLGKLEGRKRACAMCSKAGRKRKEGQGRTFETLYACEQCGVPLCRQMRGERSCFDEWHS